MSYNHANYGSLSYQPVDKCPLAPRKVCWFKMCPYALQSDEYELVNWEVIKSIKCGYPFIGRIKAEPDKLEAK